MKDESHLDKKYFINGDVFNCPFCNRGSVSYDVVDSGNFNWSDERTVYYYKVKCNSCDKESFHFSDYCFNCSSHSVPFNWPPYKDNVKIENFKPTDLDDYFFYHQPTSKFTINTLVPVKIRDLISEAEGCREMNYLVGGSGALRKAIYEFTLVEKSVGKTYQSKIKFLKKKYPNINKDYFDALANIQDMTSFSLHENEGSWKPWNRKDFDFLIEVVKTILEKVYVVPKTEDEILNKITQLKSQSSFNKNNS